MDKQKLFNNWWVAESPPGMNTKDELKQAFMAGFNVILDTHHLRWRDLVNKKGAFDFWSQVKCSYKSTEETKNAFYAGLDAAKTTMAGNQPGPLPDNRIRQLALDGMITPFTEKLKSEGVISYGLGSYGYDIRLADEFKILDVGRIFARGSEPTIDPKNFDPRLLTDFKGDVCIIPPNSYVLGRSLEYIKMPRDVTGLVLGKSTYARCGQVANFTPLEAGWEGHITIEMSNTSPLPARIYAGEGIAQIIFLQGEPCEVSYEDRAGKYQGQKGVTTAKVEGVTK